MGSRDPMCFKLSDSTSEDKRQFYTSIYHFRLDRSYLGIFRVGVERAGDV